MNIAKAKAKEGIKDLKMPSALAGAGISVATLIDHIYRETGCHDRPFGSSEFARISPEHAAFLDKLNRMSARNFNAISPDEYPPDIDAATLLSTEEILDLLNEFLRMQAKYREF